MDKYQKKALVTAVIILIVGFAAVIYLLEFSFIEALSLSLVGVIGGILFILVNKWMRPHLNNKEYPNNDWYRKHLERNYDAIILGDDIARELLSTDGMNMHKVFDLSMPNQNLYVDFIVLKNSFSILKPCGSVYIPYRKASLMYLNKYFADERVYYWALSPYVFNHRAWSCIFKKIYTRIPALMLRWRDVIYIFRSIYIKDMPRYLRERTLIRETKWLSKIGSCDLEALEKQQQKLFSEIDKFCKDRDLNLVLVEV